MAVITQLLGIIGFLVPAMTMLTKNGAGFDPKSLWFVAVTGLGVFLFGYFGSKGAWRFGLVTISIIIGGGAQLWLTQPLWYPALTLASTPIEGLMALLLAGQACIALWVLTTQWTFDYLCKCVRAVGAVRLLLFLVLSTVFSLSLMGYVARSAYVSYAAHFVAAGLVVGTNLLSVLALSCLPAPALSIRNLSPKIAAALVFFASALLAVYAFETLPHVEDEVAYLFQARTLATGALTVAEPPEAARAGLDYYLLPFGQGNWIATTPPAWPAVLAVGVVFNSPWLVNPLLAGLSLLLAHSIVSKMVDRNRANWVVLLMATSPWFLGTAASLMPHMTSLSFMLISWWLLLRNTSKSGSFIILALVAGLCMGWVFVTRQLDGVLIGTLTGIWLLAKWQSRLGVARVIAYSVGCILTGSLYLFYNYALTGNLFLAPLDLYLSELWHSDVNAYGFGPDVGLPNGMRSLDVAPGHSPGEAALITLHNLFYVHLEFLGWGIGSLAPLWILVFWGRLRAADAMMMAIVFAVILALFFYWFSGSFYIGPRYWFSLYFPLLILSAGGIEAAVNQLKTRGIDHRSFVVAIYVMCIFGLFVFTPWRGVEKFYQYGNFRSDVQQLSKAGAFGSALVFFEIEGDPGSVLVLNDPLLPADKPLFVRDLGADANAAVVAAYPERKVLYYRDGEVRSAD